MTTTAYLTQGLALKVGNGASPEVFTTIYEVRTIGDFGQENDLIEVTHMQSLAKEFIYGMAEGVEFPLTVNYKPTDTTHVALLAAQAAKTTLNFKMVEPSGGGGLTWSFSSLVKGWRLPAPGPNNERLMNFNMKISGAITGPV